MASLTPTAGTGQPRKARSPIDSAAKMFKGFFDKLCREDPGAAASPDHPLAARPQHDGGQSLPAAAETAAEQADRPGHLPIVSSAIAALKKLASFGEENELGAARQEASAGEGEDDEAGEAMANLALVLMEGMPQLMDATTPVDRSHLQMLATSGRTQRVKVMPSVKRWSVGPGPSAKPSDHLKAALPAPFKDLRWESLSGLLESELLGEDGEDEDASNALVEINSGGKVFFGLLGSPVGPREAVCIKFCSNKLATQSEFFAYELAGLLGVRSPECRLVRKGSPEWKRISDAGEALASGEQTELTQAGAELLAWMKQARCLILIAFSPGSSLHSCSGAFCDSAAWISTAEELGRVLLLDMVLCNPDRLAVSALGWRGNASNIRASLQDGSWHVVSIDHTVPRRPPAGVECNPEACARMTEVILRQGQEGPADVLREVMAGFPTGDSLLQSLDSFDEADTAAAMRKGFQQAIERCLVLRGGLEMLRGRLEDAIQVFLVSLDLASDSDGNPASTVAIRKVQRKPKADKDFWDRFAALEGNLKEQLKAISGTMDEWRESAQVMEPISTGFLDGAQALVQIYELKVRLGHVLSRMDAIVEAGAKAQASVWEPEKGTHETSPDRPILVHPSLFIGGILAAGELSHLKEAGITHIVNATGDIDNYFPDDFDYLSLDLDDTTEAADQIAATFETCHNFIDSAIGSGGAVLVHCFEGRSRSGTLVLSYLVSRQKLALRDALHIAKTAHPPTRPNYGFMGVLRDLDIKVHGKASTRPLRKNPAPAAKICPVCQKNCGVSLSSLSAHVRKVHPEKVTKR